MLDAMLARDVSAGALIRLARTRAGLTQRELAARVGTTQSVISAYEGGRRQPGLTTLVALIEATGHDLHVDLRPVDQPTSRLSGPLGLRVRRHRARLVRTAAHHGATNLRVFGSVARGDDRPDSDVDLLVDLPTDAGLLTLLRLERDLGQILHANVDLVPADAVKLEVRPDIDRDLLAL
jgi:predicted nucleotidyltransferase/DNA-binding XRE family transcriptional regulator